MVIEKHAFPFWTLLNVILNQMVPVAGLCIVYNTVTVHGWSVKCPVIVYYIIVYYDDIDYERQLYRHTANENWLYIRTTHRGDSNADSLFLHKIRKEAWPDVLNPFSSWNKHLRNKQFHRANLTADAHFRKPFKQKKSTE